MGKRKRERSDEEIRKKIERLEKKLRCREKTQETGDNNGGLEERDYDSYEREVENDAHAYVEFDTNAASNEEVELPLEPDYDDELPLHTPRLPSAVVHNIQEIPASGSDNGIESVSVPHQSAISNEILAVLGQAKTLEENFGTKIPEEIAERWGKILIDGLVKEHKETLISKTLVPENFQLAKAPKLNAEVASILNEATKNRDKRLERMQNQLGAGISGLTNLTSELISNEAVNKMELIKKLSETTQILLDLHYEETMNRRRLILPTLDKSFLNVIQGVKREKFLFGDNLSENIRTSKSIEKSSLQIKKCTNQPSIPRRALAVTNTGNLRGTPRHTSGLGAPRMPPTPARYYAPFPPAPPLPARRQYPPPPPGPRRQHPPLQPPANTTTTRYQDRRSRR